MDKLYKQDTLIEIVPSDDTAPFWHGKQGRILRPAGEGWPNCYVVQMVNGTELFLHDHEFKVIHKPDYPHREGRS